MASLLSFFPNHRGGEYVTLHFIKSIARNTNYDISKDMYELDSLPLITD